MRLVKTPYLKTPATGKTNGVIEPEPGISRKSFVFNRAIPMLEQAHQELVVLFEQKLYLRCCPKCVTGAVQLESLIPDRGHRLSCVSCGFSVETSSGPVSGPLARKVKVS